MSNPAANWLAMADCLAAAAICVGAAALHGCVPPESAVLQPDTRCRHPDDVNASQPSYCHAYLLGFEIALETQGFADKYAFDFGGVALAAAVTMSVGIGAFSSDVDLACPVVQVRLSGSGAFRWRSEPLLGERIPSGQPAVVEYGPGTYAVKWTETFQKLRTIKVPIVFRPTQPGVTYTGTFEAWTADDLADCPDKAVARVELRGTGK